MRIHMRYLLLSILAVSLFALGGCSDDLVGPGEAALENDVDIKQLSVVTENGVTTYEGVIGGENQYAFVVPDDWNGELVLYAHGFIDSGVPFALPVKDNAPEIRDRIVGMGFAWAYCSYRENGLAVKDGAWATRILKNKFAATVKSKPSYTWLIGHSMGGLIGVELAETHAREYDGIVTIAGMIGGTKAQLDYVGHVRVLFDIFYPGVLPGSVCEAPENIDLNLDVIYPVMGAIQADPNGLGIISRMAQTPLPGRDGSEIAESLITALVFSFRGLPDVLERTGGACPFDNMDTDYAAIYPGLLPQEVIDMINAAVQRHDRSIATDELFERYYEPSGRLTIPMIAVHNEFDPVVPLFAQALYAAKVEAMGYGHNLETRVITRYAHTDFPAVEAVEDAAAALMDLRSKVIGANELVFSE